MKTIAIGFALATLLAGTALSQAAEAWKEAKVNGKSIFTDANGMTLYTFDKDKDGMSNCYDTCATNWPPLKAEADAAPMGEWTVIERKDGSITIISSIGADPSDQLECRCRSPRSAARRSPPPRSSAAERNSTSRSGSRPDQAWSMTLAVLGPMPGSDCQLLAWPCRSRAASSRPSMMSAALRYAITRLGSWRLRSL